jgi:hypothetical protein
MNWGYFGVLVLLVLGFLYFVCGFDQLPCVYRDVVVLIGNSKTEIPSVPSQALTKDDSRPSCYKWHTVNAGETQWVIARQYAQHADKGRWIKSMRWVSRKSVGDDDLKAGESVCVGWGKVS